METSNEINMQLGASSLVVSRLGIGAITWDDPYINPYIYPASRHYGASSKDVELRKAVDISRANGIHFIDMAALFKKGASDHFIAELTKNKEIIVATRFPSGFFTSSTDFPKALDNSLKRFNRTSIDLYQINNSSPIFSMPKVINQMAKSVHEGKIKAVGVINFSAKQLRQAYSLFADQGVPLASNLVEYSLLHRDPETNGVLDACHELNVTLIANGPFRIGALPAKYLGINQSLDRLKHISPFRIKNADKLSRLIVVLYVIGNRYSKSPVQVALRWLIQQGNILVVPGAKNGEEAIQNAGALKFSLLESECLTIRREVMSF